MEGGNQLRTKSGQKKKKTRPKDKTLELQKIREEE